MADLLGGMVYAAIMATFATLKDECAANRCCQCAYRDENYACLFMKAPSKFDLDKISKALQKDDDSK